MILAVVVPVLLIGLMGLAIEGQWLGVLAGLAVIGLVVLMAACDRENTRAYSNRRRYWARGGPDRYRRRQ